MDQKICRDCEHTYDREESFLSVSLPVKSRSLQESLKEHVKGEMLEGENAYLCEKCQEKVLVYPTASSCPCVMQFLTLVCTAGYSEAHVLQDPASSDGCASEEV